MQPRFKIRLRTILLLQTFRRNLSEVIIWLIGGKFLCILMAQPQRQVMVVASHPEKAGCSARDRWYSPRGAAVRDNDRPTSAPEIADTQKIIGPRACHMPRHPCAALAVRLRF